MLSSSSLFSVIPHLFFFVHYICFHLFACLFHGLDDIDPIIL